MATLSNRAGGLRLVLPLLCALAALAIAAIPAMAQAPRLSRYVAIFPARITAGEYSGDYDIFGAGFNGEGTLDGMADQPKLISSQRFKETSPVAIPDMEGGYYLAYTIEHSDSAHRGDHDILMRHIDGFGVERWGDSLNQAVVVAQSNYVEANPRIAPLGDGSLLVFYELRYGTAPSADVDIAVVRLARDGTMLWSGPRWGAKSKKQENLVDVIPDGRGGAIALIEARSYRDTALTASDVLAQRIDSAGTSGWKDSPEPAVVAASPYLDSRPVMVSDGDGGAYVAYQIEYNKGERAGDIDIIAQHLTRYGNREWTDELKPPIVSSNAKAWEQRPAITRDSSGIIVAFEVSFQPAKMKGLAHVIGIQRLDSAGQPTWNGGKKSKLIGLRSDIPERPQLFASDAGGCYLLFEGRDTANGDRDVYVQRIASDGDQIWGDGERPLKVFTAPGSESAPSAVSDGLGGLIVVATRHVLVPGLTPDSLAADYTDLIAQRVANDGSLPWQQIFQTHLTLVHAGFVPDAAVVVKE